MPKSTKIIYWNAQALGQKRSELIQLITHLKIDIVLINETHLNSKNKFTFPNFITYRNDRKIAGRSNYGGTAILIHRNIVHSPFNISTKSIENTVIHININGVDLRLVSVYKSPGNVLNNSDLDSLLDTSADVIIAGDLNAKNKRWHSSITNPAGITWRITTTPL